MKAKYKLLILYIVAIIVCVVIIYAVPSLAGLLKKSYVAEPGEIELAETVDAYIVREDTVYVSDKAGDVNRIVKAGELTKAGSRVVELTGNGRKEMGADISRIAENLGKDARKAESGISATAGYVSYNIDGAENRLTAESIGKLDEKKFKEYTSGSVKKLSEKVSKGEPIFKVTKNGEWWIVFFVSKDETEPYTVGRRVEVTINDETVRAYVKSVSKPDKSGSCRVILRCNVYLDGYLEMRQAEAKITLASAKGLLIDNDSIVTKDQKRGVIVVNKIGSYVFKPIYVKADNGETSAVAEDYYMDEKGYFVETVKVYDEILSSPSKNDIKEAA